MSAISLPFALSTVPRYRCHKEVRAFKIGEVAAETSTGGRLQYRLTPAEDGPPIPSFQVDSTFIEKHKPQAGGYFVIYDDGYMSYSPAKAFEEGYAKVSA